MAGVDFDSCGDRYAAGDLALYWTVSGSVTVSSSSPRIAGGSFIRMAGAGVSITRTLPNGAAQTVYIGFAIRVGATPLSAGNILEVLDTGSLQMALKLNTDLTLSITRGSTVLTTTATALSTGTWYFLEFSAKIDPSTGTYALRLNATDAVTPATGQNTRNTSNSQVTAIRPANSGAGNIDIDDYYCVDPSTSAYTGFLGDVTVEYLPADGAGNSTQWSPQGSASNYQCVDELNQNGDTDYCSTSTSGNKDTFSLQNLSVTPQSVIAAKPIIVARKDDTGTANVAVVVRSGGTDYTGSYVGLGLTYAPISKVYETDPATGVAFTASGVNALQAGYALQ